MARLAALVLVLLAFMAGGAQATTFRVVVVSELDLAKFAARGAVGLLVPGAGPETSRESALASLVRGRVENSLRGGLPEGPVLLSVSGRADPPAIYVTLPPAGPRPNDRRYPVAVVGGGFQGLLESSSTRIPGLVSIVDIAPTALGRDDALGWERSSAPVSYLRGLDAEIESHNDVRIPATLLFVGIVVLLAFVLPRAALVALVLGLAANLALGLAGAVDPLPVLLAFVAAGAVAVPLARLADSSSALVALCAGILAAYLVAFAVDGPGVALSPFGPSQNARFYGLSNLLGTILLAPALAGAAAAGRRFGPLGFAGLALLALALVAGNRFGADGGGAIVFLAGFAVLAGLLSRRALLPVLLAGSAAVGLLLALDLATGSESHVTRAVEEGPTGLADDLADRVTLSVERATDPWYLGLLIALGIGLLAWLAFRAARGEQHAPALALAAAIAVSLVVNDSPNDVVLLGLAGFLAVERGMLPARWAARSSSPSHSRWPWPAAAAARRSSPSRRR